MAIMRKQLKIKVMKMNNENINENGYYQCNESQWKYENRK